MLKPAKGDLTAEELAKLKTDYEQVSDDIKELATSVIWLETRMGVPLVLLMVNEYHHIYGIGYYFGLFKVFDIVALIDCKSLNHESYGFIWLVLSLWRFFKSPPYVFSHCLLTWSVLSHVFVLSIGYYIIIYYTD